MKVCKYTSQVGANECHTHATSKHMQPASKYYLDNITLMTVTFSIQLTRSYQYFSSQADQQEFRVSSKQNGTNFLDCFTRLDINFLENA